MPTARPLFGALQVVVVAEGTGESAERWSCRGRMKLMVPVGGVPELTPLMVNGSVEGLAVDSRSARQGVGGE